MPTYVYECTACGHQLELFQKMSDPPAEVCPECGGKLNRLPGAGAGIIFKGSGFYATDYRSRGYREKAKEEGGSKPSGDKAKEAGRPKDGGTPKDSGTKSTGKTGD